MNIVTTVKLLIIGLLVLFSPVVEASLYEYPANKRPAVSLKEAERIAEMFLTKLGVEKQYYVVRVNLHGDERQTGAGAWNLVYSNSKEDKIHVGIYLTKDLCLVTRYPKDGGRTEKGYTRNGQISKEWLKVKKNLREKDADDPFSTPKS